MSIYSGYINEEKFRKNLISNIKKSNYEDLKDNICSKLDYSLSPYDVLRLAITYKKDNIELNKKIEYILTDCNFHSECSKLMSGKVNVLIKDTKKEIEDYLIKDLSKIYEKEYFKDKKSRGFIPANSSLLNEYSIEEQEFLVSKGILQKRDCEGLAYEFTDSYIQRLEDKEIEKLWEDLEDVPFIENEDKELVLDGEFLDFEKGTNVEDEEEDEL